MSDTLLRAVLPEDLVRELEDLERCAKEVHDLIMEQLPALASVVERLDALQEAIDAYLGPDTGESWDWGDRYGNTGLDRVWQSVRNIPKAYEDLVL